MKRFYVQHNIGKAKYVVSYHDGSKRHQDRSDFFDIALFRSKKALAKFLSTLTNNGYLERLCGEA